MAQDLRSVRVFVSSTFRDMEAERDELAKRTFVLLRKLCMERGVTFSEVDLRWGITDEKAAEGRVLPVCLEEIRRCRPFFVGILGERYGWVPESFHEELVRREPWLREHEGKSVTEMEILHGVLNDPGMADRSYLYLRDPGYAAARGEGYVETDPRARANLAALKTRIRESGLPVREGYTSPVDLGLMVYEDLAAAIDDLYPEGSAPDLLTRERRSHSAFGASRTVAYVGRDEYFEALEDHLLSDTPPLVVVGDPGVGKSSLLAAWAARLTAMEGDLCVLPHFVGAGAGASDWRTLVRRLAHEIVSRFRLPLRIPQEPSELKTLLPRLFEMVETQGGRVVVLIAGLDQMEGHDQALHLPWLPDGTPKGITLVVSTLPGPSLAETVRRGWPQLQIYPLTQPERRQLVTEYLRQYRKELDEERTQTIVTATPTGNPLFLTTLLGELRLVGTHETLDQTILAYLEAEDTGVLLGKVLERYEHDYERERPGLVRDTMRFLWAARRGLAEDELLALLGGEAPLPRAHFSPLFLAAEEWLSSGSGLLRFAQPNLRDVVEARYVPTVQEKKAAHLALARHFRENPSTFRAVDELPWQLLECEAWGELGQLLSDDTFLQNAWAANRGDVHAWWTTLERRGSLRVVDAYRHVLETPGEHGDLLSPLWELLTGLGYRNEVLALREARTQMCRASGDREGLQLALGDCARVLIELGRCDQAWETLDEQERIGLGEENPREVSRLLHHRAMVLQTRGELDTAADLLRTEEAWARKVGDTYALSYAIAGQSSLLMAKAASRGDVGLLPKAEALSVEHERLSRQLGDQDGLADALQSQASIRHCMGDTVGAKEFFDNAEEMYRASGNRLQLANCLLQRSVSDRDMGNLSTALSRLEEAEQISRSISSSGTLAGALCLQADILQHLGQFSHALDLASEALTLARELGDVPKARFARMMVEGIRRKIPGSR